ncbi:putative thioredoxin [Moniliophthora roreri MCA 2997]|uniref:Thioredoxin n=1 Tax=Moniliophthora roreri (strain MCA 2997) TaxID=1381753 RepID=V2WEM9_MONRO|nr:putative thioredoxin [Moniliophthora roreri MCA 2997]
MPSFLSKVFGNPRKKHDKDQPNATNRHSDPSLLEGKFEAVSPNVSPTADNFHNEPLGNGKEKDGEGGFSLFRTKSSSPEESSPTTASKNPDYFLPLNLPSAPKEDSNTRALGVVFEGDDVPANLTDAAIGRRRLNPVETLALVRACSQEIMDHGLETLGVMHPHWYSASPETQRHLITLFVQSLASKSPSPTISTDPSSAFEYQISTTRSMHDVAAVLRWGLRHLQLEGSSFGNDPRWYTSFFEAERNASYPPRAFSEQLTPLVSRPHMDLLSATLAIFSSLAAHAEANGISGSKLSMLLGLWLLNSQRSESGDDWKTFYDRWERNGRMLEHLFLSHIRDEAASNPMPKRLTELVQQYPYTSSPTIDSGLLPRTRFSTRRYDALFIHIDTEKRSGGSKPPKSFTLLLATALTAEFAADESNDSKQVWEKLKQLVISKTGDTAVDVTQILSDETLRLISLSESNAPTTPTFNLVASDEQAKRRSLSPNEGSRSGSPVPPHHRATTSESSGPPVLPTISKIIPGSSGNSNGNANGAGNGLALDWSQFSSSGFLESSILGQPLAGTLMDKDVEVTKPPTPTSGRKSPSRKSSEKRPGGRGRKSLDALPPISIPAGANTNVAPEKPEASAEDNKLVSRATQISFVKLDEAFIDFWSDALLDPISDGWPRFVICRLKSSLPEIQVSEGGRKLEWLVVEQKFVSASATIEATPTSATETISPTTDSARPRPRPRPTSPKPSLKSFGSSAKKRFTFWSSSKDKDEEDEPSKTKKKKGGAASSPKIGEMGEILKEEDETETAKKRKDVSPQAEVKELVVEEPAAKEEEKKDDVLGTATLATGVIAAGAAAGVAAGLIAEDEEEEDKPAEVEEKDEAQVAEPKVAAVVPDQVQEAGVTEETKEEPEADAKPTTVPELETKKEVEEVPVKPVEDVSASEQKEEGEAQPAPIAPAETKEQDKEGVKELPVSGTAAIATGVLAAGDAGVALVDDQHEVETEPIVSAPTAVSDVPTVPEVPPSETTATIPISAVTGEAKVEEQEVVEVASEKVEETRGQYGVAESQETATSDHVETAAAAPVEAVQESQEESVSGVDVKEEAESQQTADSEAAVAPVQESQEEPLSTVEVKEEPVQESQQAAHSEVVAAPGIEETAQEEPEVSVTEEPGQQVVSNTQQGTYSEHAESTTAEPVLEAAQEGFEASASESAQQEAGESQQTAASELQETSHTETGPDSVQADHIEEPVAPLPTTSTDAGPIWVDLTEDAAPEATTSTEAANITPVDEAKVAEQTSVMSDDVIADEPTSDSKAEAEILAHEQASDEVAPPDVVEDSQQPVVISVDNAEESEPAKEESETTKEVQDVTSDAQQEVVVPPIENVQESIPAHEVHEAANAAHVSEETSSKADAEVLTGETSTHAVEDDEPVRDSTPTHEQTIADTVLTEQISAQSPDPMKEDNVSLPPIPIVEAEPAQPASTQPPPVDAFEEVALEKRGAVALDDSEDDSSLPPAPASVVAAGETPGPEVALSSSEPVAQKIAAESNDLDKVTITQDQPSEPPANIQDSAVEKETA